MIIIMIIIIFTILTIIIINNNNWSNKFWRDFYWIEMVTARAYKIQ